VVFDFLLLAYRCDLDAEQGGEFPEFARDVANSDRAMVRRAVSIPIIHKSTRADGKAITAVRVADFENWTRNRLPFCGQ
jgi:hypothetical protein